MGVEPKIGVFPPKSSILIRFSIINHPFWGTPYFWKHLYLVFYLFCVGEKQDISTCKCPGQIWAKLARPKNSWQPD